MDAFITSLDALPVIGVVFQFLGYIIEELPFIAFAAVQLGTPIGFGALCGVMCERSGVVNIGIEGTMLVAAFSGWVIGIAALGILGPMPAGPLGVTPALVIALIGAVVFAVLTAL